MVENTMKYYWEITFDTGQIVNKKDKPNGFDPLKPDDLYGIPIKVRMVPQDKELPTLESYIPIGAYPVCFRQVESNIEKIKKIVYYCGWNMNGIRNMIAYNVDSNNIYIVSDNNGNK